MLKFKIDTDGFNALSDEHKAFYAQKGDEYVLQVDGAPDADEIDRLRNHADTLLAEKKAKDEQARQALADKLKAEQEAAIKSGDAERIQEALSKQLETERGEKERLKKQIDTDKLQREVGRLSSRLTTDQSNQDILNVLLERQVTVSDGQFNIVGLNGEKLDSIEQLEQQVLNSGKFDSLLTGTLSSGTGGNGQGGGATKSANEYTEAERIELAKTSPEQFNRLFKT